MQSFDSGDKGLREHDHAGIVEGAEDLLELRHRAD